MNKPLCKRLGRPRLDPNGELREQRMITATRTEFRRIDEALKQWRREALEAKED